MGEKSQINLVVNAEQKQEWEDAVEADATPYQSLSHLIRFAVERELGADDQTQDVQIPDEVAELGQHLQRMQNQLLDVSDTLESVEAAVHDDPQLKELASEVFRLLPTSEEVIEADEYDVGVGVPPREESDTVASGRVDDLAERVGEPEHRVREALRQLQQDMAQVRTTTINGETRYLKEE